MIRDVKKFLRCSDFAILDSCNNGIKDLLVYYKPTNETYYLNYVGEFKWKCYHKGVILRNSIVSIEIFVNDVKKGRF